MIKSNQSIKQQQSQQQQQQPQTFPLANSPTTPSSAQHQTAPIPVPTPIKPTQYAHPHAHLYSAYQTPPHTATPPILIRNQIVRCIGTPIVPNSLDANNNHVYQTNGAPLKHDFYATAAATAPQPTPQQHTHYHNHHLSQSQHQGFIAKNLFQSQPGNTPGAGESSPSSVSEYDSGNDQLQTAAAAQQQHQSYYYPSYAPYYYPATPYQAHFHHHMQQHQLNQHHPHQQHQHHQHMQQLSPNTSISKTNLYIRGLSETTTDQDLHDMCKMYGPIKSTKAIIDKQTLKCKGYGFVDFINQEDAQFALKKLKELEKDVQLAKQREQDPTNLYFANLPHSIDETSLTEMLQTRFNVQVSSTRIMRERTGQSKGVGFARIDESVICDRIIQELNQKPYPGLEGSSGTSKVLLVKLADTGNQKRQRNLTSSSSSSIINATNIPPLSHHQHQQTPTPTGIPTTTQFGPIPVTNFNGFPVYNSFSDGTQTPLSATPTAPALLNSYLSFRNPAAAQVQYVPNGAQTTPYYIVQPQQQQQTQQQSINTKNGNTPTPTNSNTDQQYAQIQQQFASMSLINAPPQYYQQQSTELYTPIQSNNSN